MKKIMTSLVALLIVATATFASNNVANAATFDTANGGSGTDITPRSMCTNGEWGVSVANTKNVYIPSSVRAYGSVGATISISISTAISVGASISTTVGMDVGVFFGKVSASIGVTVTNTYAYTTTYTLTGTIPKAGAYIEWGAVGRYFTFTANQYNANCAIIKTQTGTATAPVHTPYGYLSWVGFTM